MYSRRFSRSVTSPNNEQLPTTITRRDFAVTAPIFKTLFRPSGTAKSPLQRLKLPLMTFSFPP